MNWEKELTAFELAVCGNPAELMVYWQYSPFLYLFFCIGEGKRLQNREFVYWMCENESKISSFTMGRGFNNSDVEKISNLYADDAVNHQVSNSLLFYIIDGKREDTHA